MKLLRDLAQIVYPPKCVACGDFLWEGPLLRREGSPWFCAACLSSFERLVSPLCPVCGIPFLSGAGGDHLCEDCMRRRPSYDSAWAPFVYAGPVLAAVHRLKYASEGFVADILGPLLASSLTGRLESVEDLLVMPVPLHPRRIRERGFNQSLLLARHVAGALDAVLDFLSLRRVRYTLPQARLSGEERSRNVRGAFGLVGGGRGVEGRQILLVDDVITTGNTLNECARVLKGSGASAVFCAGVARALK